MCYFKKVLRILAFHFFVSKAKRKLAVLSGVNKKAKLLKIALQEALADRLDLDEKELVDKIELLRNDLNSSDVEISITDYGASSATSTKTEEQMAKGNVVIRTVGTICRSASKPYFWSVFLFKIIKNFKPSTCLELGTCLGISASYQASALKLNGKGRLFTLEGAESLALLACQNFQRLGLENVNVVVGRFGDTLDSVLKENKPIDYAFIDGHHDQKATITYFNQIYPFLSDGAIVVFDDISWSKGMKQAWQIIKSDQRVGFYIDLFSVGICIIK